MTDDNEIFNSLTEGLENPAIDELYNRLNQMEAAGNSMFTILTLLAAREGGVLHFTAEEWQAGPKYHTVTYGEDMLTEQVVIQFL